MSVINSGDAGQCFRIMVQNFLGHMRQDTEIGETGRAAVGAFSLADLQKTYTLVKEQTGETNIHLENDFDQLGSAS